MCLIKKCVFLSRNSLLRWMFLLLWNLYYCQWCNNWLVWSSWLIIIKPLGAPFLGKDFQTLRAEWTSVFPLLLPAHRHSQHGHRTHPAAFLESAGTSLHFDGPLLARSQATDCSQNPSRATGSCHQIRAPGGKTSRLKKSKCQGQRYWREREREIYFLCTK